MCKIYDAECIEVIVNYYQSLDFISFVSQDYRGSLKLIVEKLNNDIELENYDKEFLATIKQEYIPVKLAVAITQLIGGS